MEKSKNESKINEMQLRYLWVLMGRMGWDRETVALNVQEWTDGRTGSTKGLTYIEAQGLIRNLEATLRVPHAEKEGEKLNRMRKGVLKAICAYIDMTRGKCTVEYAKGIACRAGGKDDFNRLSEAELSRIYYEFCAKQRACDAAVDVANEILKSHE